MKKQKTEARRQCPARLRQVVVQVRKKEKQQQSTNDKKHCNHNDNNNNNNNNKKKTCCLFSDLRSSFFSNKGLGYGMTGSLLHVGHVWTPRSKSTSPMRLSKPPEFQRIRKSNCFKTNDLLQQSMPWKVLELDGACFQC